MIVGREDIEQFKLKVEKGFEIHDSAVGEGVLFNVTPRYSHDESYDVVFKEFEGEDFIPVYRRTGDGLKILIVPKKIKKIKARPIVHLVLLIITTMTIALAGYMGFAEGNISQSIMFAAALVGVLGIHELGHSLTARRRGIDATLPFFIPAPPVFPWGTLGAIIFMGAPAKNRNSLLEVGIAGPLAGFLVCIPVAAIGLKLSTIAPMSAAFEDEYIFTMPLILKLISDLVLNVPLDPDVVIEPHPVAMAAWGGFFVTALNLLPIGQLDGGHVVRVLAPVHYRKIYLITAFVLPVMLVLFISPLWILAAPLWALLLILMWVLTRLDHPGPLNDVSKMDGRKKIYGAVIFLLLLILCFPPTPPIPTELLSNV